MSESDLYRLMDWVLDREQQPVSVAMNRQLLFTAVSALQLSRRAPGFPEAISEQVDHLIQDMQSLMPDDVCVISRKGDDPAYGLLTIRINHDS